MAFIKTKLSTIRPNDLYDTLRLTYGFNNEEDQKKPGILAKPAEPVSDSDVVAAGFFDYMLTKSRERAAKLRAEAMEQYARDSAEEAAKIRSILGITRSKAPTGQLSDTARDAMFSSSDMRGTDLTMMDNAREAQEVFQPMITPVSRGEQPEMADSPATVDAPSVDTRSNEMLDKAIQDVLETVLDSDVSDSTDSADGGAAPSDGKGIMSPKALTDDDMGLPTERSETERLMSFEPLFNFIEKGEGGYEASNRGTIKNAIIGSTTSTERNGKALTEMTIGEIREKQAITDANNPERLFAVGRFQVIPSTLEMAISSLELSDDTIFNENTQNKIGMYLVSEKRPNVGRYLKGVGNISQNTAMLELAKEFASMPVPYDMTVKRKGKDVKIKKGDSYYGSGNKAQHSYTEVKKQLEELKGTI